jgi:FtsP/CotA-like multicopper oxidase with cupredoxin domain
VPRPALIAVLTLALAPAAHAREYWIAAQPTNWNPVINGVDALHGTLYENTLFPTVTYRAYTRGWGRPANGERIPGPLLRARVGDRLKVHFKNLDPSAPHSMHFHGVSYKASSDGSYLPGFSGRGAAVGYRKTFTYELTAGPDSAGVWSYHDHGPAMEDAIAGGMYGALSILARGERAADREFVVFFSALKGFETVNGRAFVGNTPVLRARVGDTVQWDVLTLGDEMHTFHVHGHRWLRDGVPEDTRSIGPAESFRVRWKEDAPGTWLYHCHFEAHMMQGMIGLYRVSPTRPSR